MATCSYMCIHVWCGDTPHGDAQYRWYQDTIYGLMMLLVACTTPCYSSIAITVLALVLSIMHLAMASSVESVVH